MSQDSTVVRSRSADNIAHDWKTSPRWRGVERRYSAAEVVRLRPSIHIECSLARHTSQVYWQKLHERPFLTALGTLTGSQAVQMVRAGLESIYVSGWQVAADANLAGSTYPDQSLYPSNSVPALVRRLNQALMRADQISKLDAKPTGSPSVSTAGEDGLDWYVPILADAEAGFGGAIHAFELMRQMVEAGAAGVHFEDQLASEKKCGHLGGKVLVPTSQFVNTLNAARLAADVLDVPTLLVARTDAHSATLLTSDIDERDQKFIAGARTAEGYYRLRAGLEVAIDRALSYAPYADLIWFETSTPDLGEAREFAAAVRARFPDKLFAYNCSPSFNWKKHLDDRTIEQFREQLAEYGFRYQFITLAGWHTINLRTFELARDYRARGMAAYVALQEQEFAAESKGYTAARHQREVGTGYFDQILMTVAGGSASTAALKDSTESEQF